MDNNSTLRRLRYALNASDERMAEIFALKGRRMTADQVRAVMLKEDEPGWEQCGSRQLADFLDGFIISRRGPPRPGTKPSTDSLTNNMILKKLRIALKLQEDDMLRILSSGGQNMSRGELTALFRKPDHKHYRECGDQAMRYFLKGLTMRLRPTDHTDGPAA
ncbi:MAG: hypothetical protein ACI8RZ_007365 [Myxococcota bacterium]|jgi:uncharacterized protein YehS (DUF1456 family)